MIRLCRTSPAGESSAAGLRQFLVDMKTPGSRSIPSARCRRGTISTKSCSRMLSSPNDHCWREVDGAWKQATSELASGRSGPERFLDTIRTLVELVRALGPQPEVRGAEGLGRLTARSVRCGACLSRLRACCRRARSRLLKAGSAGAWIRCRSKGYPAVSASWRRSSTGGHEPQHARGATGDRHHVDPKFAIRGGARRCCAALSPAASGCAEHDGRK